jgi:hypothetical protein
LGRRMACHPSPLPGFGKPVRFSGNVCANIPGGEGFFSPVAGAPLTYQYKTDGEMGFDYKMEFPENGRRITGFWRI